MVVLEGRAELLESRCTHAAQNSRCSIILYELGDSKLEHGGRAAKIRTQKLILIHESWPNIDLRKYAQVQG